MFTLAMPMLFLTHFFVIAVALDNDIVVAVDAVDVAIQREDLRYLSFFSC